LKGGKEVKSNGPVEIAIIGGGASGLAAAIAAADEREKRGLSGSVLVVEKNQEAGRKLLATGNGRCNFSNRLCSWKDFHSNAPTFARGILERFSPRHIVAFFESLGLWAREEEGGRVYPLSGQAASLRKVLVENAAHRHVEFLLETSVVSASYEGEGFRLTLSDGEELWAKKLIIASGGRAGMQFGSDGDGYGFAKSFGHTLVPPHPALVAMTSQGISELKGVRVRGKVALLRKGEEVAKSQGEIQFGKDLLSGICCFDVSRFVEREAAAAGEYALRLDVFPDFTDEELNLRLWELCSTLAFRPCEVLLHGLLPEKLSDYCFHRWGMDGSRLAGSLTSCEVRDLCALLKDLDFPVTGTLGWKEAQVSAGGVNTEQIDPVTLESKLQKGLYFAGEVLDVDGPCGGYNLQWAFASGIAAGRAAAR